MNVLVILKDSPQEERDYSNISADDRSTLELLLSAKDLNDKLELNALSITNDELLLREALSLGVDKAIMIRDDENSKEKIINEIKKLNPDIIISGKKSKDLLNDISNSLNIDIKEIKEDLDINEYEKPVVLSIDSNKQIRYSSLGKIFKAYDKEIINL